ncbi:MAG TPA: 4-(cytidine 5'-diphospho)-2-C-methyl-D-erythritol kinase [Solibacterales bacterium]|nr:4-(cytidine 5'-diphospho)-2-C-methyl-D-erythritol kinase [Bryobacterales bacterium]
MTRQASLSAFAKLNLDLRVLHKRADGYHELRTVFQTISLADRIRLAFTPGRSTTVELDSQPTIPDNLVERAARAVLEASNAKGAVRIALAKRIPMGAGLGGGSSDAAAILLALPVLTGRPLALTRLEEIALQLGSDVPFFLHGGAALGLGRGEELYPLPDARLGPILVVAPAIHVSTAEAYRALHRELTFTALSHTLSSFRCFVWSHGGGPPGEAATGGANDFEDPVFARHPDLRKLKTKLKRLGARHAMMSGSGSSLFGIFRSEEDLQFAADRFAPGTTFAVKALPRRRYQQLWRRRLAPHTTGSEWPPLSRYSK